MSIYILIKQNFDFDKRTIVFKFKTFSKVESVNTHFLNLL